MKRTYNIYDLDCAHCAAKLESEIAKIKGVESANVNFIAQKLIIEAEDDSFEAIIKEVREIAKKVEPDCTIEF